MLLFNLNLTYNILVYFVINPHCTVQLYILQTHLQKRIRREHWIFFSGGHTIFQPTFICLRLNGEAALLFGLVGFIGRSGQMGLIEDGYSDRKTQDKKTNRITENFALGPVRRGFSVVFGREKHTSFSPQAAGTAGLSSSLEALLGFQASSCCSSFCRPKKALDACAKPNSFQRWT